MARPSNTEQRRAQIISGLITVMAKHGYDGASIADIAKAADLTAGLVHYHFKSKQEILLWALRDLSQRHLSALDERLAEAGDDPIARLAALIDVHLGLGAHANPEALACWILLSGEALRNAKIRGDFSQTLVAITERIAAVIRQGRTRGVFRCDDVEAAASALTATIQGYFVLAATARAIIPKGSAARATKRMADGLLNPTRSLTKKGGCS
jgi:TetR/AcrR family transcriptional repressor of bet genes